MYISQNLPTRIIRQQEGKTRDEHWFSTSVLLNQYSLINRTAIESGVYKGLSRRRFAELLDELRELGLVVSHTSSEGRHGYHAKYMLTEDPELVAKAVFIKSKWDDLEKLKEGRKDFLLGKLFPKVLRDFGKKYPFGGGRTIMEEMNDWSWNLHVYGETMPKVS